jgi:16S rRNA G1207 methylase RsmC
MTTEKQYTTTADQVREALIAFHTAHLNAEDKIAAAATLKAAVGSNETERKIQKAATPADEYAGYVAHLVDAERVKQSAVAHLERAEKALNVLRELYAGEVADKHLQAANRQFEAMTIADKTAETYRQMPGNYTTHAEFRARYPVPTTSGIKRATVAQDDGSELPF